MSNTRRIITGLRLLPVLGILPACAAPNPMKLESTFRLDGPITLNMQMNGPSMEYEGTFISEELFKAIELKETSAEWVLAAFGEPDRKGQTVQGGDLWVWQYRAATVQGSPVKIMNIGDDDNQTPPSMTVVLEIVNGVVLRKWRG